MCWYKAYLISQLSGGYQVAKGNLLVVKISEDQIASMKTDSVSCIDWAQVLLSFHLLL